MRLVKLQDRSVRAVTGLDLLMKFGFGDSIPTEFISGNRYESGQYAYTINEKGTLDIYRCVESGVYNSIGQGWVYATIASIVKDNSSNTQYINPMVDNDYNGEIYDTVYYTLNSDNVSIINEYIINVEMNLNDGDRLEVYINNKYISNLEWVMEPIKKNVYQIVPNVHVAINELAIIHRKKRYVNANLVGYSELHPKFVSVNGSTFGELPETEEDLFEGIIYEVTDSNIRTNQFIVDLFYKGLYIDSNTFSYEFDETTRLIKLSFKDMTGNGMITDITKLTDFVIVITYSRSSQFVINKRDIYQKVCTVSDCYRVDLVNISNRVIGNNLMVYSDSILVPPESYDINNLVLSITDSNYYAKLLDGYIVISSKSFSVMGEYAESGMFIKKFVENTIIDDSLQPFCVPFVDWNADVDDMIMFKSSGVLVNPNRYFVKNGYVIPYDHEVLVSNGTTLEFHSINNDNSSFVYNVDLVVTNTDFIKIPYVYYQRHLAMMIFNSAGMYISKNRYTIDENLNVVFNDKSDIAVGDVLTFIFIDYRYETTYSVANTFSIIMHDNYAFNLPLSYNPNTDHLIMFNDNGMYISTDRYTIDNGKVTLLNGSESFKLGSSVDIYVIRSYNNIINVASIPDLIKVF